MPVLQEEERISQQLAHKDVINKLQAARSAVDKEDWEAAIQALNDAEDMLTAYSYGYPDPTGLRKHINQAQAAIKKKDKHAASQALDAALTSARKTDNKEARKTQANLRASLATDANLERHGEEFLVTIIDAGDGNGFTWTADSLRNGAQLFNGLTAFVNHERRDVYAQRPGGRIIQDVCGVYYDAFYDEEKHAIRAKWRPTPPAGDWTARMINTIIKDREAGLPVPNIGISADVSFAHTNGVVTRLIKAHSADIVFDPARGPTHGEAFARIANQVQKELEMQQQQGILQPPSQTPPPYDNEILRQFLAAQRQALLETRLANSNLPQPMQEAVRNALPSEWTPNDLDKAIKNQQDIWAKLQEDKVIQNIHPTVSQMTTGWEQFEEAFLAMIEGRQPRNGIRPLSGIREAYILLSGDYEMTGLFHAERVQFANANSTTMAGLVANALNKVVINQFQQYPRFWEPVVTVQDFTSLQTVRWITLGGIGELPDVNEGAAYTEMTWDDNTETSSWAKKGGYLGITLEAIDRDDTRRIQQAPRALAQAAWLTLGKAFAKIFTDNNALADGVALFHANHNNLGSSALSFTAWDATRQAMRAQTELNSGEPLGALTAPKYLLVPNELEQTALQILFSAGEPGTADNDENPFAEGNNRTERLRSARERVIVVDFWTDPNDWVAMADPKLYPSIGLGYRFGRTPEIFSVADPNSGLMFTNDVMPIKVRWFFAIGPVDYRGMYKHVVA